MAVGDDHASSECALGLSVAASYAETGSALDRSIGSSSVRPSISARGEVKYETTILSFMIVAGALETSTIHVVPKNKAHEAVVKKLPTKMPNQPFEATFRLQVSESVSQ